MAVFLIGKKAYIFHRNVRNFRVLFNLIFIPKLLRKLSGDYYLDTRVPFISTVV